MSTITTINADDQISDSRATINTNFDNLNNDKLESSVIQRIYKSADETVNNSTVLQNDNELAFTVGANEVWAFEMNFLLSTGSTPDFKMAWTIPSGTTGSWAKDDYDDMENLTTVKTVGGGGTIFDGGHVKGIVFVGSTAGTVQFQWAQNTQNASDTKVLKGSYIIAHKLA